MLWLRLTLPILTWLTRREITCDSPYSTAISSQPARPPTEHVTDSDCCDSCDSPKPEAAGWRHGVLCLLPGSRGRAAADQRSGIQRASSSSVFGAGRFGEPRPENGRRPEASALPEAGASEALDAAARDKKRKQTKRNARQTLANFLKSSKQAVSSMREKCFLPTEPWSR